MICLFNKLTKCVVIKFFIYIVSFNFDFDKKFYKNIISKPNLRIKGVYLAFLKNDFRWCSK